MLAASPALPALRPGVVGIVFVELFAVAWLRLARLTDYRTEGHRRHRSTSAVSPTDVHRATGRSPGTGEGRTPRSPVHHSATVARNLGRLAGGARRRMPDADAVQAGARRAGTQAGRLQRAWRRAAR
ncbi:MAG: hypothetical protein ACRDY1_09190 [Acidimicrobiales bacterium]